MKSRVGVVVKLGGERVEDDKYWRMKPRGLASREFNRRGQWGQWESWRGRNRG